MPLPPKLSVPSLSIRWPMPVTKHPPSAGGLPPPQVSQYVSSQWPSQVPSAVHVWVILNEVSPRNASSGPALHATSRSKGRTRIASREEHAARQRQLRVTPCGGGGRC